MSSLRIRTFARYAELLGDPLVLDLPMPASVADLAAAIRAHPNGDTLPSRLLIAVNHAIAESSRRLDGDEELALLPPLAGG